LVGANHHPTVNVPWTYMVTVTDARGQRCLATIEFPAAAVGHPLKVQAVVHTRIGSVTLDWPIAVQK
jgi:hypothetical protein